MAPRSKYTPTTAKLLVKRSKAGLGLFAGEDIAKGECIIEYTGRVLPNAEADNLNSRYLFSINKTKTLDGSPRSNTARYANHGCRPNAESDVYRGRVYLLARRKIRAGEEITYNYGKEYFDMFIKPYGCRCSAHETAKTAQPKRRAALKSKAKAPPEEVYAEAAE
jgi:SET domain-containing protein